MNRIKKAGISRFERIVICLLSVILIFPSFCHTKASYSTTSTAGKTEKIMTAVYAHAEYTVTLRNAVYAEGGADDGKILTDTKYSSAFEYNEPVEGWVKIQSYDGNTDFRVTVDIDLGFDAKGLNTFYSRNYKRDSKGIGFPTSVKYYLSDNGKDFDFIGYATTTTDTGLSATTAIYRLITEEKLSGRYVRAVFECDGSDILYINEICAAAESNTFFAACSEDDMIIDRQGVQYSISGNEAKVAGITKNSTVSSGKIKPSDASFNEDGSVYVLGQGSKNEVTVISDFIDESKDNYSGAPNLISSIVIHNTGTTHESTDAARYNRRMHNSTDTTSWHYTVDENEIYHSMPDQIAGWHSGPSYNYESIGIEMCVNGAPTDYRGNPVFEGSDYEEWVETRFIKTIKNTAMLTAELLTRYGLSTDAVKQHYDVTEKNCPMWLRADDDGAQYDGILWKRFMQYVCEYYELLNGENATRNITVTKDIVIPDYIVAHGDVYPVTAVDEDAFSGLGDRVKSIEFGSMVKYVDKYGFDGSDGIEKITLSDENEDLYINSMGLLCDSNGIVIYDPNGGPLTEPVPKTDSELDIRNVDGRYFLFLDNDNYLLSDIRNKYGCEIVEALDSARNDISVNANASTDVVITFDDGARIYLIVRGDINSDGKITARDYIMSKRIYFGTYSGNQRQISAAALNNGEEMISRDYIMLKRHYFGTFNIFA